MKIFFSFRNTRDCLKINFSCSVRRKLEQAGIGFSAGHYFAKCKNKEHISPLDWYIVGKSVKFSQLKDVQFKSDWGQTGTYTGGHTHNQPFFRIQQKIFLLRKPNSKCYDFPKSWNISFQSKLEVPVFISICCFSKCLHKVNVMFCFRSNISYWIFCLVPYRNIHVIGKKNNKKLIRE